MIPDEFELAADDETYGVDEAPVPPDVPGDPEGTIVDEVEV